jgi:hypothetical protein
MENQATNQGAETNGAEAVSTQDTAGVVENTNPSETSSNFEEGGELKKGGEYSLVYLLTFALLISASAYSIYYHRQAMNKLMDDDNDELKRQVREVKTNLKKLMGNKYEIISK